ncbi:NADH-quinone oxidoreductase subunit J [Hyphobacterium sp. HN65]|uniref:NADH-quinone oxidoreductase subunit J n=1 Tax=Hyphobacterium lacteum TaxID=3116575 RepID=A0ABU7LLS9_9PROT|nr:NADH-quinone oxidoreductase subunit J [Hyphobacterium sp. HN65]MEE2524876.1 NADH-quinone oxidoreductase subunit J [Hyphobacterium sp. HN65]
MLQAITFWVLASVTVLSAFFVVSARNPVRSVLWLILSFFSAAGLFVLLGAEFLAMLLIVVYVGAVAVLFLFVVMMLDVDFTELKQGFLSYLPFGGLIAVILAAELILVGQSWGEAQVTAMNTASATPADVSNVEALGMLLYDDYAYFFQAAGLILLVAMIGAIVLTLQHKPHVKRQNIAVQVGRDRKTAVTMHDVKPGEGLGE